MLYFHSWSGGKDSTASVILDHEYGLPPSTIVMSEVMFDKKRGITGEIPEHMEWVHTKAKPLFESWGYKVVIIHADKDYLDLFYHTLRRSSHPERIGKRAGFPIGGKRCSVKRDLKIRAISQYYKQFNGQEIIQYVSIAADEYGRLPSLEGTNQVSLLDKYGYTEQMAFDKCRAYDLLSPTYDISNRGGCWFCPNQGFDELAYTKLHRPELYAELERLSHEDNLISQYFRYSKTFSQCDTCVNRVIEKWEAEAMQISLFDFMEETE